MNMLKALISMAHGTHFALSVFLEDSVNYAYLMNVLKTLISMAHTLLYLCS